MSRRSLFSNRNSLSQRVLNMMASLFRRRWGSSPVRRGRHGRLASRMTEWFGNTSAAASRVMTSSMLTLAGGESLEGRQMLATDAYFNAGTGNYAIWTTGTDTDQIFVSNQSGPGFRVTTDSTFSTPVNAAIGAVTPTSVFIYGALNNITTNNVTIGVGGTGYTAAPTVSFQTTTTNATNPTYGQPLTATATLRASGVSVFTAGAGYTINTTATIPLINGTGGAGATASVTVALGVVTAVTVNAGGAGYTSLAGLILSGADMNAAFGTPTTAATATFTGSVNALIFTDTNNAVVAPGGVAGTGYYSTPVVVFTPLPAPGTTATATVIPTIQAGATTATLTSGSTFAMPISIGNVNNIWDGDDIETVNDFASGSGALAVYDSVTTTVSGGDRDGAVTVTGTNINLLSNLSGPLTATAKNGGLIDVLGGQVTGVTRLDANAAGAAINIGSAVSASSFTATAHQDVSINGAVTGGTTVFLRSTAGKVVLNQNVTAGSVLTLESPLVDAMNGTAVVTAGTLVLLDGGGTPTYTLNTNVGNLAGSINSNLSLVNSKALAVGSTAAGGLTVGPGVANLSLTTRVGNIDVAGALSLNPASTLVLNAAGSVAIGGFINSTGGTLNAIAQAGSINASGAINLGAGTAFLTSNTGVTATQLNVATVNASARTSGDIDLRATAPLSVQQARTASATGDVSVYTSSGDLTIAGPVIGGGTSGSVSLLSALGNIDVRDTVSADTVVLNATKGLVSNTASANLTTKNLNFIASTGAGVGLLTSDAVSNYSTLDANIIDATNPLVVLTGRDLTLQNITTRSGLIQVTAANAAATPNLTVNGPITAGGLGAYPRMNVTLRANQGAITSTAGIVGDVVTFISNGNSTVSGLTGDNVTLFNADIQGEGKNLTVSSSSDSTLSLGNVSALNGTITIDLSGSTRGSIDRTGGNVINAGTGSVVLRAGLEGGILGNGLIDADLFDFRSNLAPNIAAADYGLNTGANFSRLAANLTQSGDLTITRSTNLTLESAIVKSGNLNVTVDSGIAGADQLTINGPVGGASSNVTLNVINGSIATAAAAGAITADVLDVTTLNDLSLNTSANTLVANVGGNLAINETNGLTVGSNNVTATNNITLNVAAGNLTRTGQINSTSGTSNIALTATAGNILGNGRVIGANAVIWTSKGDATIDSNVAFGNLSVNSTAGIVAVTHTGAYDVLNASGVGSVVLNGTDAIAIGGNVNSTGTVTLNSSGGAITVDPAARISGTNLTVNGTAATLYTNVTSITGVVTAGDLNVTELNDLQIAATNVNVTGDAIFTVGNSTTSGNLTVTGELNATGNTTLTASNGAITGSGLVTGSLLTVNAKNASSLTTAAGNLAASVTAGGLTVTQPTGPLGIDSTTGVTAAGPISITASTGWIGDGASGVINAGTNDVTLNATVGGIMLNSTAGQVTGNVLNITAGDEVNVNTAVNGIITNVAGNLTVDETNGLSVNALNVVATNNITLNVAAGNLTGPGSINSTTGGDVTLNTVAGAVDLPAPSLVSGGNLNIAAQNTSRLNTNVSAVTSNISGVGEGITFTQSGDLSINGSDFRTQNGSIEISVTGNLSRTGNIDAGTANVTLIAGGNIVGAGLISGNILNVAAATSSSLNTAVGQLSTNLTAEAAALTVTEADDLIVNTTLGVRTTNGAINIVLDTGNLTGDGSINAGSPTQGGSITLNAATGGITLNTSAGQIRGSLLNVAANNTAATAAVNLATDVADLAANIQGAGQQFTVRQVGSLVINAAAGVVGGGLVDIQTSAGGSISGDGAITTTGDVILNAANLVSLNAVAGQVQGVNLTVVAANTSALRTNVTDLNASISSGGLNVTDVDDLTITQGQVFAAGPVALTATTGNLTGTGASGYINAGANAVTLTAQNGITFDSTVDGQITGGALTLKTTGGGGNDATVKTSVSNLTADVQGNLTVLESSGLTIGTAAGTHVNTTGDLAITLSSGSLTGSGAINATGNATISLLTAGSVTPTGTITADVLNITLPQAGSINVSTAANEARLSTGGIGSITISEADSLTANVITASQGDVNVTLATGHLSIVGAIDSGVSNNVILSAVGGNITSTDLTNGVVYADGLTITAQNSSDILTTVTSVTGTVTGQGQTLTITEQDDATFSTPDGLAIGAAGIVSNAGDIAVHLLDGNLTASGAVSALNLVSGSLATSGNITINVANGNASIPATARLVGNVLSVSVHNSSTLNTNVARLQDRANSFAIDASGTDVIDATAAASATTTPLTYQLAETNINVATFTAALKYEDLIGNADPVAYNLVGNADGTISFTADAGFGTAALISASLNNTTGVLTLTFDRSPLGTQLSADYLRTLTVNNLRDLAIGGGDLSSNSSADIVLNVASGNIRSVGTGNIVADAGNANVTLNAASGSINTTTGPSIINANLLTLTAKNSTTVNTTLTSLAANVAEGTLSVYESDNINIAAGNVVAANAITINAAGQISGNGIIRSGAGTQNVTLNADNLSLTAANQVVGNVLTVAVANSSTVRTNVNSITGTVTGNLADLTVTEANSLSIRGGSDLTFANGTLNVALLSGSLTGSGNIVGNATSSTVNLSAAGGNVTLSTGNVTAVNLIVSARDTSSVNTAISNVAANVTVGGLTITEKNDLNLGLGIAGSNSVVAAGGLSITAGGAASRGNIASGAGAATRVSGGSGDVSLTTTNGSITLNEAAGLVSGARLTVLSQNDVAVNTAVTSLVANVASGNLTVREADDLQIGANVTTTKGDIDILLGGNLSVAGAITANAGVNNVTLNSTAGSLAGAGLITANVVTANAVKSSSLNLNVNTVVAGVSGEGQSLTVTNTKTITLDGPGNSAVNTANGSISVNSTAGYIVIKDSVNAGTGNVTFAAAKGNVSTSGTGKVVGNVLTLTAQNSSVLNTAVTGIAANITGSTQTLTVNEDDGLAIAAAGVKTNNGSLILNAGGTAAGTLTIANAITAGNANIVLKNANGGIVGTATINANVLTVNATGDSSLSTNVTQIQGQITGTRSLTINQVAAANGIKIGASDLNIGSGTLNLNIANGSLTGNAAVNGKLVATTGAINVNVAKGNIGDASTNTVIDAGTGSVSLNAAAGGVTLNNVANQVKGGALSLNALGTSTLRTDVTSVVGSITGSGNTLTIVDNNALTIGLAGLSTTNGNVSIRAGDGANSNLTISGPLSAGTRDVTLNAPNGTIGGAGLITAANLGINSSGATTVSTNIGNLSAKTAGTALTVTEANDLSINAAGIATAGGNVTIVLSAGNLGGAGVINAGAGDVSLKTAAGNVTLRTAQAVRANNLSLTALNSSAVNTTVSNIAASITGLAQSLTVNETNDLALAAAGISTNNGNLAVTLAGSLTGSGKLALGTGTATLTSTAGNITPAGTITAGTLVLTAQNTSSVNTTITSLQAKVSSGGLTVTETADLAIAAGGVNTTNAVTLNVLAGNLTGTGNVSASDSTTGNVTLNVAAGNVTLNTIAGQVRAGNLLNISANTTSVVNSNAANLTATIRNGGLTVVEANDLNIFTGGIDTSGANGPISLTLKTGSLSGGSNLVNAGLGNVNISAAGGNVTLSGTAGQVAGNVLTLAARGDTSVRTAVNTLDAVLTTITGTGNLSVTDTNDLTVNRAVTTNGNVTLSVGANTLTVNNITAARATLGDVTLIAKNVVVNGVGITASDNLDLTGVTGNVNVTAGVMNAASVGQVLGSRVNWQVNTLESGAGSLRSVITNTNNFKGKSQVNIATPTTITLASSLPWITSDLKMLGNNNLTINAGSAATGLVFNGANASVSNVALSGFSGAAITLLPNTARGIVINGVTVTNSAVGLQASGTVTGSTVSNSTFDGLSRANAVGISLSGTSGLTISKNTLRNATIGLQASGSFTNTLVQTNTFDRLSRYGISLASATSTGLATGLVIGPATGNDLSLANTMTNITGSGTAGVFATGFCTNTVVRKTVFRNVTNPYAVSGSRNLTINN